MANNIRGITIEIGGDTTKLGKAIEDSEKKSKSLESELSAIQKQLKFDPKNVELLSQKQTVLTEKIAATKDKLDTLKEAEKQVIAQFERGEVAEDQVRALQLEIITTTGVLDKMEKNLQDTKSAIDKLGSTDTFDKLSGEIREQESELSSLKKEYANVVLEQGKGSAEAKELASKISNLSDELNENKEKMDYATDGADKLAGSFDNVKESSGTLSGGFSVMKGALANLVADGIRKATEALTNFAKQSLQTGLDFESSMAEVQAISGATGEDFKLLQDTAKEYGATTVFSASESAQALKYMSLAGWDAQQSAAALGGVLDLASASGMDLAQASDMVTDYLSAFGMEAKESAYFADMLAYAQANSNTSVEQLGEAFKNSAASMNAAGQDVETTTALLAQMANQGFKGSEAGTALTAIMRDMTAKMKEGAIMIGDTSVQVQDANGNYRDMTDILLDVEKATDGMGEAERATALATTFTADSTKGLNLLLNAGVGSAQEFEEALRGSAGTAEDMGATMNDTAAGDIKQMQSALEDLQISLFDELQPTIRDIIQTITNEVLPVVKDNVIPAIREFIGFITDNGDKIISVVVGIGAAFIAWNVASMIMGVIGAIKSFTAALAIGKTVFEALNLTMKANPILLIASLIAMLVAGLITFIATNENARAKIAEVWENIKQAVSTAIGAIAGFFTQTIPTIINNVVTWFNQLPTKISNAMSNVLAKLVKFGVDALNWVKTNIPKIVSNVVTFFKQLPGKVWSAIVGAISYIAKWGEQMRAKASSAASSMVASVISTAKQLPGKIWSAIVGAVSKVATWGSQLKEKGVSAVKTMSTGIVNQLKSLPNSFLSIGKNIVEGLWNGISNAKDWILSKISGFGKSIIDGAKNVLGIHSPSKVFETEIGANIAKGLVKGIESESKNVAKAAENMANSLIKSINNKKANAKKSASELSSIFVSEAKSRIKLLQDSNKISEADTVAYWKAVLSHTKKGTNAYRTAYAELVKSQKALNKTLLSEAKDRVKKLEEANKITLAGEVSYWTEVRKQFKKGTSEYKEATNQIVKAKAELNKSIKELDTEYKNNVSEVKKQLIADIQAVTDAYDKAVADRQNQITSSLSLFSAFSSDEAITKESLTENLKSQVDALREWDNTLDSLAKKTGMDSDLMEDLQDLGVSSLETLKELNSMSEEELRQYVALYRQKEAIALERSEAEHKALKKETEKQIKDLIKTANKQLNSLEKTYNTQLKALGVSTSDSSKQIGKDIVKGLQKGIESQNASFQSFLTSFFSKIVSNAQAALEIHSPSRVFADLIGANIPAGIAQGIKANTDTAQAAVSDMSDALVNKAEDLNGLTLSRRIESTFANENAGGSLNELMSTIRDYGERLIKASDKAIVLDSGVLVGETIDKIDSRLGNNYSLRERRI